MTYRNCIICNSSHDVENYCEMEGLLYVRCDNCGLIYVNKFASKQQMDQAYTGGAFKSFRRKLLGPFRKMRNISGHKHWTQRASQMFQFVKSVKKNNEPGKMLDIGANKGFLLEQALKDGHDVYGVELVRETMLPFITTYPKFTNNIFFERFSKVSNKFSNDFFDIITATDVLEHLEDPVEDVKNIYRILKKSGIFVAQTPDVDCENAVNQKCKWPSLNPLEHLHLFGRKNIIKFAKDIGFSDVQVYDAVEDADGALMVVMEK